MRILFFGTGEFGIPTFRSIRKDGHEIVAAVTQPDRPRGRGKDVTPTPLKAEALAAGVPVHSPPDVNVADVVAQLRAYKADLAYVAAFGQKIGHELLNAFPVGIINLHGSLLPQLRGAAPVQRAVMNGLDETGVTLFRLVSRMDAGPILVQRRTGIGADETADELHDRLARIGCDAARATLELLAAEPNAPGMPQDETKVTLAPKLSKAEGRIRFDAPARELTDRIRGMWSWPGAICRFVSQDGKRDEQLTIARAVPYEGRSSAAKSSDETGRVTEMMGVQVADREMMILELKPAGGRLMAWQDFVNGRHVRPGDRFVAIENM